MKDPMNNSTTCRVLVVDDNRDTAESLAMLLRLGGHEVDIANDGLTAIQNAVFFRPDVVLLDLGLPGMHGHDVCRQICERVAPARPLMIAITGHGQEEIRKQSYEAGFNAHLLKPVDFDELAQLIDRHCAQRI
jgi:CheY-like chemotaxis protein